MFEIKWESKEHIDKKIKEGIKEMFEDDLAFLCTEFKFKVGSIYNKNGEKVAEIQIVLTKDYDEWFEEGNSNDH